MIIMINRHLWLHFGSFAMTIGAIFCGDLCSIVKTLAELVVTKVCVFGELGGLGVLGNFCGYLEDNL